ncbi:hypothetical protein [Paenibacillus polymyxa]|uniref:hypothetical protein n=1 Tax=Paenibacillus polymyxa TaxID=1406 RepID=UPI002AB46783|nr:hypothetical protein [Paenibacillus polymyxa]MDY8026196.1 hypothetical protein [Paenibacillus polymyxa]
MSNISKSSAQSGVCLAKGQVTELKFAFEGKKVLEKVNSIYTKEFAAGSMSNQNLHQ